jgi:hypothetical protein
MLLGERYLEAVGEGKMVIVKVAVYVYTVHMAYAM